MRTSYYISRYKNSFASQISHEYSDIDENLFDSQSSEDEGLLTKEKELILKWLRFISQENPMIADGLDDSIVSWFIQSGYLLPKAIGIRSDKKVKDLTTAISVLVHSGCLSKQTMSYMKDFVETAPPLNLVWRILEDVYHFAMLKQKATVPLAKVIGGETCILQRDKISSFLKALGLPKLPNPLSEPKEIIDDRFRNGELLFSLYEKLTGESTRHLTTAVSSKRAIKNMQIAIALFVKKDFIDESFINSAASIVSGNQFALQHLLSMILVNVSRTIGPLKTETIGDTTEVVHSTQFNETTNDEEEEDYLYDEDYNDIEDKKAYVRNSRISDGTSLPKLITTIDPKFIKIPYILVDPRYDVEKKWNVRKTAEYLMKDEKWPSNIKIDTDDLFNGEEKALQQLFVGITSAYPSKFSNPASKEALKEMLCI